MLRKFYYDGVSPDTKINKILTDIFNIQTQRHHYKMSYRAEK